MLTDNQRAEMRQANAALDALVVRDTRALIGTLDMNNPPAAARAMQRALPAIVTQYGNVSATVASEFYEIARDSDNVRSPFRPTLARGAAPAQVSAVARWALSPLWTPDGGDAASIAELGRNLNSATPRLVRVAGRATIERNAAREGVRYARVPRSGSCGFCQMLAGRGAVYHSKETAGGHDYHDHCNCTPERIGKGELLPYDAEALFNEYAAVTRGLSGADAIRAMNLHAKEVEARAIARVAAEDQAGAAARDASIAETLSIGASTADAIAAQAAKVAQAVQARAVAKAAEEAKAAAAAERQAATAAGKERSAELRKLADDDLDATLSAAYEADDEIAIKLIEREYTRREKAETDKIRARERRAMAKEAEQERINQLIADGMDGYDAVEEVTGITFERQRMREIVAEARAYGDTGRTFDQIARERYRTQVAQTYVEAEDVTNGRLLNAEGQRRADLPPENPLHLDDAGLFTGPAAFAERWASSELREFWDSIGGRDTFEDFKADLVSRTGANRRERQDLYR
ncbi:hypothetical protein SAMN04515671_2926 [Nakamurella panacisegetis]|uniref:Capsid maturation protease n=1 Tax=Nakamurella panacisegetis TaxID=1090615 RepID=A0A1H0PYL6_9ACTN|nr:hypothetical protein [Nakamurella panacisegetis]SDP09596.1 hypothetical protein SAMN04515671_2926 [Nakamurella panacisegetis]